MPLKFTQRKEEDVPAANNSGRVNQDLLALKTEMQKLSSGMVLEIEAGSEKAVRPTKVLITRAANQLGKPWQHWHVGSKVFAKPSQIASRRASPKKNAVIN